MPDGWVLGREVEGVLRRGKGDRPCRGFESGEELIENKLCRVKRLPVFLDHIMQMRAR
jgi:hypothetical protein